MEKVQGNNVTTVTNWVKKAKEKLDKKLKKIEPNYSQETDIIELDEIYTYVQKNKKEQSYGLLILDSKNVLLHITQAKANLQLKKFIVK